MIGLVLRRERREFEIRMGLRYARLTTILTRNPEGVNPRPVSPRNEVGGPTVSADGLQNGGSYGNDSVWQ